jgi:hypothetical protein
VIPPIDSSSNEIYEPCVRLLLLSHRKYLFPGEVHVVDLARVLLDIGHQFVIGFPSNYLPAVALHDLCHRSYLLSLAYTTPRLLRVCWERVGKMLVRCR